MENGNSTEPQARKTMTSRLPELGLDPSPHYSSHMNSGQRYLAGSSPGFFYFDKFDPGKSTASRVAEITGDSPVTGCTRKPQSRADDIRVDPMEIPRNDSYRKAENHSTARLRTDILQRRPHSSSFPHRPTEQSAGRLRTAPHHRVSPFLGPIRGNRKRVGVEAGFRYEIIFLQLIWQELLNIIEEMEKPIWINNYYLMRYKQLLRIWPPVCFKW